MARNEHILCEGVKWVNLVQPSVEEVEKLTQEFGLNNHTVKDCLQPEHLPKYELDNGIHFLILRFYAHEVDKQMGTIQELTNKIAIFFTNTFIVTIHQAPVPFLDTMRDKFKYAACTSTTDLAIRIVWNALETFDSPALRLSEQIDFYERGIILKKNNNDNMEALYYIKRQASVSSKILMLMLEPINHLFAKTGEEAALQDVKDQHLKMQTLYNQVLDDVTNLTNLHLSFSSQRTNDVMKVLTIFSVFFMPLTFIVGIYGMNFDFMPELRQKWGYPSVMIFMAIITVCIYLWFKRKGWL